MKLATDQPARHPRPTTKAQALAYLMFDRPDLEEAERFLHDFGLRTVMRDREFLFLRGTAASPYCYVVRRSAKPAFAGFGLEVSDMGALEALTDVPGASPVERLDWPGGGYRVSLVDPSGFRVDAIAQQAPAGTLPHRPPVSFNSVDEVTRVNATRRVPVAAPEVVRLGHLVLELADFQKTCAWYTRHFGFVPSDVQVLPDGSPAVVFLRLDRGGRAADHHTLALAQGFAPLYSHSAYEVIDVDAVAMGQRVLRDKGWNHAWGIGRHVLGSQVFDYWHDPFGDKHEHYCDGDLFTADEPMGVHAVSREAMSQWGPVMPASFTRPKLRASTVSALIRNLCRSPDVTVAKMRMLAKIFA